MTVCSVLPEHGCCLVLTGGTGSAQELGLWSQADLGLNLCLVPYQLCDPKQVAFNLFMPQLHCLQNMESTSTYLRDCT